MQPTLESAGLVVLQRPEDADEGLLREILGVLGVAGKTVGEAVDAVAVLTNEFVPRRHGRAVPGGVERRGAAQVRLEGSVERRGVVLGNSVGSGHVDRWILLVGTAVVLASGPTTLDLQEIFLHRNVPRERCVLEVVNRCDRPVRRLSVFLAAMWPPYE